MADTKRIFLKNNLWHSKVYAQHNFGAEKVLPQLCEVGWQCLLGPWGAEAGWDQPPHACSVRGFCRNPRNPTEKYSHAQVCLLICTRYGKKDRQE